MPRETLTRRRTADGDDPTSYIGTEEEAPRVDRAPRLTGPNSGARIATGWGDRSQLREKVKPPRQYAGKIYPVNEKVLLRFLEPAFTDAVAIHWLFPPPKDGQQTTGKKRPYLCFNSLKDSDGCPFCDELGHRPVEQFSFNVAVWADGDWGHQMLVLNNTAADLVQAISEGRHQPINRPGQYFDVYRTGNGKEVKYQNHFDRVTNEDLAEDPNVQSLTSEREKEIIDTMTVDLSMPASDDDVTAAIEFNA